MARGTHHRPVLLQGLPAQTFVAAVTYLADILRECQLVLVGQVQGAATDPALGALAEDLVPALEEVRDAFVAADIAPEEDGTIRLATALPVSFAARFTTVQMHLIQLRMLGRNGGLLVRSDPAVTQLIAWIWDEASDQLHGREPRAYHRPST
jgi:hypothetical protein